MKAFIFVALVASVAARSLDLETLRLINKEKSVLSTPVTKIDGDLLKEQMLKKNIEVGQQNLIDTTILPVQDKTVFGGIYEHNLVDTDRVLTIQELYSTELFKEYLTLPIFRQYIQYPSFVRFVQSVYFQKFWQLPAYKQYFVNPVLFYKYVYPIVQLFNTEYNLPTEYGQHEDVLGLQTLVDNVLLNKNKNFLPYAYNYNRFAVPTTTTFPGTETTNYKFLLEKLYKNLTPQQQQIVDVKTDVKLIPTEKVAVEPITNQIVLEEPKIVDVQVEQKIVPFTTTDKFSAEDNLLLKELLQYNIIDKTTYEAVIFGKIPYITFLRQLVTRVTQPQLLSQIVGRLQVIDTIVPETTFTLNEHHLIILKDLLEKQIIGQDTFNAVLEKKVDFVKILYKVLERKEKFSPELISLIINYFVEPTVAPLDTYLLKELYRQHFITSQVYQYGLVGKFDLFSILRQVILRSDIVDTVYPVEFNVELNERIVSLLKDFYRQNLISKDVFEAVLQKQIQFVKVLEQVLERKGFNTEIINLIINHFVYAAYPTQQEDFVLLQKFLQNNYISLDIYKSVVYGKLPFQTVLYQVIFQRGVVDTVFPYASKTVVDTPYSTKFNFGTDFVNKYYGYNKYNTEIPTIRDTTFNTYNRFPIVA